MISAIRNLYYVELKTPDGVKYSSYVVADNSAQAGEACKTACPEDSVEEIKLEKRVVCA